MCGDGRVWKGVLDKGATTAARREGSTILPKDQPSIEKLRESEARLAGILAIAADAIISIDEA